MGSRRAPAAALFALLLALPFVPVGAPAAADGRAATAATDYTVASGPAAGIFPNPVETFVNGTVLGYPEISFDGSGNIVLAYHENGSATFARFVGTTTQPAAPPTQVSNRTTTDSVWSEIGRGPHAALNGLDQIVTAYWDYIDPGTFLADRVYVAGNGLDGAVVLNETMIGETQSFFWPAPSVAIGLNDSIYVAREVSADDYNFSSIGLDILAPDGSPVYPTLTVFNDSSVNHYPQLVADLPRSRLILAWFNDNGEERIVSLALNGSIIWGPISVAMFSPAFSLTVGPDGSIYGVFIDGPGDLRASKFDQYGTVIVDRRLVSDVQGSWAKVPRCALSPQGDLFIVWEEDEGQGYGDVRAAAVNSLDLTLIGSPGWVSRDPAHSQMPHVAFSPSGAAWVVWRTENSAFGEPDLINGTSLDRRTFSFEAHAPGRDFTVYRGEPNDIAINFTSFSDIQLSYALGYSLSSVRGPWNWTVEFLDAATGRPALTFDLLGNATANALLRVTPPIWDPPGNGLIIFVTVQEVGLTGISVALQLNMTAQAGHLYAFTPSDQNATGLSGSIAQLSYQVRNVGAYEARDLPITLLPAPPAGWSAAISPPTFSALPGEAQVVTLTITSPTSGTTAEVYCGALRLQHPVDVFSASTGTFCSRLALVSDPRITPPTQSITVDHATPVPLRFTLENAGNSALPLSCHVQFLEALPSGWAIVGAPLTVALPRNVPTLVSMTIVVSPPVRGGDRLELTAQATCDGSSLVQHAALVLMVREIHDARWGAPGPTVPTDADGVASFAVTVENLGNVPEALFLGADLIPRGWTVAVDWSVGGVPGVSISPGETSAAIIAVKAPPRVEAGIYRFSVWFGDGASPLSLLGFSVQVPEASGILATFGPNTVSPGPGEVVSFLGHIVHLGNTPDAYQLRVTVDSPQLWLWTAEFIPSAGGQLSVKLGYLDLLPFEEGTLYVHITAPSFPFAGEFEVNISLTKSVQASASFVGFIQMRLPDLQVAIDALPEGLADPLLVGGVVVNVTCTGGLLVENVTLHVSVDGTRVFDSPVGPFCGPSANSYEIIVSLGPGPHTVTATIDPNRLGADPVYGYILESDEQNNAATRTFSVVQAPAGPPPGSTTPGGALGGSVWLLAITAAAGAGAVVALGALRERRGRAGNP